MNLQERIYEKIPPGGIRGRDLYGLLTTEQAAAVDCALGAMLRNHSLRLINAIYFRASDPAITRAEAERPPGGGSGAPGGLRSAWPVGLMERGPEPAPARAAAPVTATAGRGTKFAPAPAILAAQKKAAAVSPPQAPATPAEAPKTQVCRACGHDLPVDRFQILHGTRHHTYKPCHGMKLRKPHREHRSDAPPLTRANDTEPKARTGSAPHPGGEPVRPAAGPSRAAASWLQERRELARAELQDLEFRSAERRCEIALIEELLVMAAER